MRFHELTEAKKKPKPRPSQALQVVENPKYKRKFSKSIPSVQQAVADFLDIFLQHKLDPSDKDLENKFKSYKPHPVTILKESYISVWITGDLRLLYKVTTDPKDTSKGTLELANLDGHKGAYRKHK